MSDNDFLMIFCSPVYKCQSFSNCINKMYYISNANLSHFYLNKL